jgi:serine/threonine protein phosphatase PrpC
VTSFRWGAASDTGRVREGNEDFVLVADGLFVVADGMGGHRGGEIASRLAVETLRQRFDADGAERTTAALVAAVEAANAALVTRSTADPDLAGMGTTLCALARVASPTGDDVLAAVNVGDSRLYVLVQGDLRQVTEDHSLVATLERQGKLTASEAAVHPQRNILTRALGIEDRVVVDSWEIPPRVGDRYLLCSDGLFNEVDGPRVAATLRKLDDPAEAARELVRLANQGGGRDNISVAVVDVVDGSGPSGAAADPAAAGSGSDPGSDRVVRADRAAAPAAAAPAGEAPSSGERPGRARTRRARSEDREDGRRRRFTWRVALFSVALLVIAGVVGGSLLYAATRTYFVAYDGQVVAIYQGTPGGLLWVQPSVAERTELTERDLAASAAIDVEANKEFGSLADARAYVANLQDEADRRTAASTTTTSTTTTTAPTGAGPPVGSSSSLPPA